MQWKPIANKYRKGTMKSTLQARIAFICNTSSRGSEIESEIA